MRVIEFIFSSFWTFSWTIIILWLFFQFVLYLAEINATANYHRYIKEREKEIEALIEEIADSYYDLVHTELDWEVYLHHVLIWLEKKYQSLRYDMFDIIVDTDYYVETKIPREPAKPLTEQPEETIEKLYSLIKK